MKNWFMGMMVIACTALLIGCETMKGAGRDIQSGGENLERTAEKAQ